jgi:Glycosyl transferase family 2
METAMRPLEVDVVLAGEVESDDERSLVEALAFGERLDLSLTRLGHAGFLRSTAMLVERWRRRAPDIGVAADLTAARAVVAAAWIAGVRVAILKADGGRRTLAARALELLADRALAPPLATNPLAREVAAVAGRPGAGLEPSTPISVVVTVLGEGGALDALLEALVPQLGPQDEAVVVDGGSQDDTLVRAHRWASRDDRLRVFEAPGANISAGRNVGVEAARHEVIACTDAGCMPVPGWLAAFKAAYSEEYPPDLVTGVYQAVASDPFAHAMAAGGYPDVREARHPDMLVRLYGSVFGRTFDAAMPTGRSVAFTRSVWTAVGGFREDLETAEDVTFGRSLVAHGGSCLLSTDAEVDWEQRRSLAATARMYYRYGRGGARSDDARVIGRDLARGVVYAVAPLLAVRGTSTMRSLIALGAGAYLSLPIARALRKPQPAAVTALVPVAVAVKDLSKAAGCLAGLARRSWGGV